MSAFSSRFLLLICFLSLPLPARAQTLIADLSSHIIAIETDFHGAELVLFGSLDKKLAENDTIVVVVRGPTQELVMRQKEKKHGVWMNTHTATFTDIPSFYRVYSAKSLQETVPPALRQRNQIGLYTLNMPTLPTTTTPAVITQRFRLEILRKKQQEKLYGEKIGSTAFLGDKLFRLPLTFPENVPTGRYTVDIFLSRGGEIVAAQTTPLHISKGGIGAEIYLFAHRETIFYGVLSVLLAATTGLIAARLYKKT